MIGIVTAIGEHGLCLRPLGLHQRVEAEIIGDLARCDLGGDRQAFAVGAEVIFVVKPPLERPRPWREVPL
jgi:hypothetical protein